MAVIVSRYRCPTNTLGARIQAKTDFVSCTVPYDHALSSTENHEAAVTALLLRMGYDGKGTLSGGPLPSGTSSYHNVFIWIPDQEAK